MSVLRHVRSRPHCRHSGVRYGAEMQFQPIGQCIYCGTTEGQLSREHIIPHGLGGTLVLPSASCSRCAAATSKVERSYLRDCLGTFRQSVRLPTRRKASRPKKLSLLSGHPDDPERSIEISPEDFPPAIVMNVLPPARILRGLPNDDLPVFDHKFWSWHDPARLSNAVSQHGPLNVPATFNPTVFAQLVAKIGHSWTVANRGLNAFTPMAVDLALGQTDRMNYLVGSQIGLAYPAPATLHQLSIWDVGNTVIAAVRLFSNLAAPIWHVVVGTTDGEPPDPILKNWTPGYRLDIPFPEGGTVTLQRP